MQDHRCSCKLREEKQTFVLDWSCSLSYARGFGSCLQVPPHYLSLCSISSVGQLKHFENSGNLVTYPFALRLLGTIQSCIVGLAKIHPRSSYVFAVSPWVYSSTRNQKYSASLNWWIPYLFSARRIEHGKKNTCPATKSWKLPSRARFVFLKLTCLLLARTHVLQVIEWAAGYIGSCSFAVICALKIINLTTLRGR